MLMKKIRIALVSHVIKDDNLGCGALAISNIRLLDEVLASMDYRVEYVMAITDNLEQVDMSQFTKNHCEYRIYPRCKQSMKNPMRLLKTKVFEECDLAINLCGGDGYTDIYSIGRLLAESQLAWIAKMKKVPMFYAPQTIGPFNTKVGNVIAKQTLKKLNRVFVRDHKSYECCCALGIKKKTIEVIDVAFALPFEKEGKDHKRTKIGINVSGLLYNGGYNRNNYFGLSFNYSDYINKLLERLSHMKDVEVHLVPHVNSYTNLIEDDYSVSKKLAEKYGCILAPRFTSPIDAKGYISGMDIFSGARMHSTIGALSSGVPVIPVAYSRKFNGLYQALEYPWLIDAKSEITVDEAIEKFFDALNSVSKIQIDVDNAKRIYSGKLQNYKEELKSVIEDCIAQRGSGE